LSLQRFLNHSHAPEVGKRPLAAYSGKEIRVCRRVEK
jgi:hypothetical protein